MEIGLSSVCWPSISRPHKFYFIPLTYKPLCLWNVGGNRGTRRKPTRSWGECANTTQRAPEVRIIPESPEALPAVPRCPLKLIFYMILFSNIAKKKSSPYIKAMTWGVYCIETPASCAFVSYGDQESFVAVGTQQAEASSRKIRLSMYQRQQDLELLHSNNAFKNIIFSICNQSEYAKVKISVKINPN